MNVIKQFKDTESHVVASIFSEDSQNFLMDVWSANVDAEDDIKVIEEFNISQLKNMDVENWLCDANKLERYLDQTGQSGQEYFNKSLNESHLKKIAFVSRKPHTPSRHLLLKMLHSYGVIVESFENKVSAMKWLLDDAMSLQ